MNEYVTFHRVLDLIEEFQKQSPILNTFAYGNLVDFGQLHVSGGTVEYPFLFAVPQSITYDENTTTYQLSLIFADILNYDLSNEKDCVSDMSLEAKRFLSYLKRGIRTFPDLYDNLDINFPVSAIPFFERFGDHVAGVAMDCNLIIFEDLNACDFYPTPTATPDPTTTPTNTPSTTPEVTPTMTQTPTSTCPQTTQYMEVELQDNTKFKLILWNQPDFTSPATALCDYAVSGTAYGDLGTIYTGQESIDFGQHQHQFDLAGVLQPGEIVTGFTVYNVNTLGCSCPVEVIYCPSGICPSPTPTMTPTTTPTPTTTSEVFFYNIRAVSNCSTGEVSGDSYVARSMSSLPIGTYVIVNTLFTPFCAWKIESIGIGPEDDVINSNCGISLPVSCCC